MIGGAGGFRRRARRRGLVVGAAAGAGIAHHRANKQAPEEVQDQNQEPATDTNDQLDELERLAKLKEQGVLTEEEFAAQKAKILSG